MESEDINRNYVTTKKREQINNDASSVSGHWEENKMTEITENKPERNTGSIYNSKHLEHIVCSFLRRKRDPVQVTWHNVWWGIGYEDGGAGPTGEGFFGLGDEFYVSRLNTAINRLSEEEKIEYTIEFFKAARGTQTPPDIFGPDLLRRIRNVTSVTYMQSKNSELYSLDIIGKSFGMMPEGTLCLWEKFPPTRSLGDKAEGLVLSISGPSWTVQRYRTRMFGNNGEYTTEGGDARIVGTDINGFSPEEEDRLESMGRYLSKNPEKHPTLFTKIYDAIQKKTIGRRSIESEMKF